MSQQPTPGDLAPDFSLSDGRSASALWGTSESGQALVVYFFPKAFTPG
jgi:peroxiredoxin